MSIICPHCAKLIDSKYIAKHLGSSGGLTTSKRYGKNHYIKLAAHMNLIRKQKKQT